MNSTINNQTLLFVCLFGIFSTIFAGCPDTITRNMWSSKPAKSVTYQTVPVKYVIILHTVSQECNNMPDCSQKVENIRNYHMEDLGWHDIGYNFLIGGDGNVYEGTGWHKVGAHTRGWNSKSIGIGFIGNFQNKLPTEAQLNAAKRLLECGVREGELDTRYKLLGQKQVVSTESPGIMLYQEIQKWPHWVRQP